MKKLLLATTLILAASLPSKADQLPSIYLGQWCDAGDGTFEWPATEDERQVCVDASKGLMIRHGGMDGHEWSCTFVSLKHTGEKRPLSTKPRKEDWNPVVRIAMRCVGIDEKWTDQVELSYIKGGIINFESKRRR